MSLPPQDDMPGDLDSLAIHSNEIYQSHRRAGFTPRQSLYMVAAMMTQNPGEAPSDAEKDDDD